MEGEPEEDGDDKDGKHCIETLFEFFGHGLLFFSSILDIGNSGFLGRSGEFSLGAEEDGEGYEHSADGSNEGVVDTRVEDVEVVLANSLSGDCVSGKLHVHGSEEFGHFGDCVGAQSSTLSNEAMTEGGEVGIVFETILSEPPAAEQGGNKRSNKSAYINEHVENLETTVALPLGHTERFGTFFCSFGLEVVVHLTDNGLKVTFEEAITESN